MQRKWPYFLRLFRDFLHIECWAFLKLWNLYHLTMFLLHFWKPTSCTSCPFFKLSPYTHGSRGTFSTSVVENGTSCQSFFDAIALTRGKRERRPYKSMVCLACIRLRLLFTSHIFTHITRVSDCVYYTLFETLRPCISREPGVHHYMQHSTFYPPPTTSC